MTPFVRFKKLWADDDMTELSIHVSDSESNIFTQTYLANDQVELIQKEIKALINKEGDEIYEIRMGEFGSQLANGAFLANLKKKKGGKIYITIKMESEYFDFDRKEVANQAVFHLVTEPTLLSHFASGIASLAKAGDFLDLECVIP